MLSFSPNAHPVFCLYDFKLCLIRDVINELMRGLVQELRMSCSAGAADMSNLVYDCVD